MKCNICGGLVEKSNDTLVHVTGVGTRIKKSHDPVVTPRLVTTVRRAFEEVRPADISTSALEKALGWLKENDPLAEDSDGDLLTMLIEDELAFRAS